jgi:hypothetical protein
MGYGRFKWDFPPLSEAVGKTSSLFISFPIAAWARRVDLVMGNA